MRKEFAFTRDDGTTWFPLTTNEDQGSVTIQRWAACRSTVTVIGYTYPRRSALRLAKRLEQAHDKDGWNHIIDRWATH